MVLWSVHMNRRMLHQNLHNLKGITALGLLAVIRDDGNAVLAVALITDIVAVFATCGTHKGSSAVHALHRFFICQIFQFFSAQQAGVGRCFFHTVSPLLIPSKKAAFKAVFLQADLVFQNLFHRPGQARQALNLRRNDNFGCFAVCRRGKGFQRLEPHNGIARRSLVEQLNRVG